MSRSTERALPPEEPYQTSHLPKGVSLSPKGDVGEHRGMEAYELGTFKDCKTVTAKMAGWKPMRDHSAQDKPFKGKGA
jgi:hypothetical protein